MVVHSLACYHTSCIWHIYQFQYTDTEAIHVHTGGGLGLGPRLCTVQWEILAAIKFGETVRIGYVYIYNLVILNFGEFCIALSHMHAYITGCETDEFEIWR